MRGEAAAAAAPVTPTVALAFFDSAHGRYGIARSGATLLFEGSSATALEGGPAVEARGGGWRASLDGRLELDFEPLGEPVELGGVKASLCRVSGKVEDTTIDCLGTAGETASSALVGRARRRAERLGAVRRGDTPCWRSPAARAGHSATATS